MFSKIFLLVLIAGAFASPTGTLISFRSRDCESMAAAQGAAVFGTSMTMHTGVGVMFVDMEMHEVSTLVSSNTEFSNCILHIEKNLEVHIEDPVIDKSVNSEFY